MEVRDVLRKCKDNGLEVRKETGSGHWKIHDPNSGAWLFNVSSSPSDVNFFWAVRRHFRRLGIPWDAAEKKVKRRLGQRGWDRRRSAVDLVALAKAQERARERGEREPQLSDLDETTSSEFWAKTKAVANLFTDEAMEEVIDNMAARAQDARVRLLRGRLINTLTEKRSDLEKYGREQAQIRGGKYNLPRFGGYHIQDFVRLTFDIARDRNLRPFGSQESGAMSLSSFIENEEAGMHLWTLELVEATVDKLQGLKWGVQEGAQLSEPEPETTEELEVGNGTLEPNTPLTRIRYANVLLSLLENNSIQDVEPILKRLDALIGLEV